MTHKQRVDRLLKLAQTKFPTQAELNAYFEGRKDQLAEDRKILLGEPE